MAERRRKTTAYSREIERAGWKSIEHWYKNWLNPYTATYGYTHCALCQAIPEFGCGPCLVRWYTGSSGCNDTPYYDTSFKLSMKNMFPVNELRASIEKEYAFLIKAVLAYGELQHEMEMIEAGWKSIERWLKMYQDPTEEQFNAEECSLCLVCGSICRGCIVKEYTGHSECYETPYYEVTNAFEEGFDPVSAIFREYQFLVDAMFQYLETK